MRLYYIKFSALHKKPRVGETQSLIWAFIAKSEESAIEQATQVGLTPTITTSHQLSEFWV